MFRISLLLNSPGGGGRNFFRIIPTYIQMYTTSYPTVLEFLPTTQKNLKFRVNLEHFQYSVCLKYKTYAINKKTSISFLVILLDISSRSILPSIV
jgi:hypothetical protein